MSRCWPQNWLISHISFSALCVPTSWPYLTIKKRGAVKKTLPGPIPSAKGGFEVVTSYKNLEQQSFPNNPCTVWYIPHIYHKHQPFIYVNIPIPYNPMGGHRPSRISLGRFFAQHGAIAYYWLLVLPGHPVPGGRDRIGVDWFPLRLQDKKNRSYWLVVGDLGFG